MNYEKLPSDIRSKYDVIIISINYVDVVSYYIIFIHINWNIPLVALKMIDFTLQAYH